MFWAFLSLLSSDTVNHDVRKYSQGTQKEKMFLKVFNPNKCILHEFILSVTFLIWRIIVFVYYYYSAEWL